MQITKFQPCKIFLMRFVKTMEEWNNIFSENKIEIEDGPVL